MFIFAIFFSNDLKFLKKILVIPKEKKRFADDFGGAKRFESMLYEGLLNELFKKNIRTKKEFYEHAENVAPILLPKGKDLLSGSMAVLCACNKAKSSINKIFLNNINNKIIAAFTEDLTDEIDKLVPETFALLYNSERIFDIVRYVKAIEIRAQRALVDFEKDRIKLKKVKYFSDRLNNLIHNLSPSASDEKRKSIEDLFWLIEEYKVSVYAQELKTGQPVSETKLETKLVEIQRMV